jgi:chemotaxis protein MotA
MDPATILGVVIAFAAIFLANFLEGGEPLAMFLLPPMILVFGGTFGVAMASGLLKDTIGALKDLKKTFTAKVPEPGESVGQLVELAEQARRNGLLALEEQARSVDDPFLKQGVEMLVDGTEPHELRDILEAKVDAKRAKDRRTPRSSPTWAATPRRSASSARSCRSCTSSRTSTSPSSSAT